MQTNTTPTDPTLCCSLSKPDLDARRSFVREALLPHVTSVKHEALEVVLDFRAAAGLLESLEEFARLESDCCSFLTLAVEEWAGGPRLRITGPAGSEATLRNFATGPSVAP